MTRAFAALRDERRDFELRPWLFRIAHNEAVSLLRRRRPTEPLDEREVSAGTLDEQVALGGELDALRADLGALPERQRAALVLRELSGLGHAEIAQALDATPSVVKQLIFQARTTLMQAREGREMECADVRRVLSDGDGRVLRGTRIRGHLRCCPSCRMFREDIERRPQALALLAPPLSPAAGAALLERLLPAATSAGATASATAGTVVAALGPKAVATVAVVAAAAGGGALARHEIRTAPRATATPAVSAPRPAHRGPAATATGRPQATATRSELPARGRPDFPPGGISHGKPAASGRSDSAPRHRPAEARAAGPSARGKAHSAAPPRRRGGARHARPAHPSHRGNAHSAAPRSGHGNTPAAPATRRTGRAAPSTHAPRGRGRTAAAPATHGNGRAAASVTPASGDGAAATARPSESTAGDGGPARSGGSAAAAPASPPVAAPAGTAPKFGAGSRLPPATDRS